MLFNSLEYLVFFSVVVFVYFTMPAKWRWLLLLAASYFFYACWKVEYVLLLAFVTLVDYYAAIKMGQAITRKRKKRFLILSIVANIGMLAGFKYLGFFTLSANWLFEAFNAGFELSLLRIALPVGISFYVFQSLSYTIDVYRGLIKPEKHLGKFALFVSFFPQLISGPISRATSLMPQINNPKPFNQQQLLSGLKLMLWGFFKKVVIADRLAMFVNYVYDDPAAHKGLTVILATVLFAFQLYCDFSGYTDIARGSARILGYNLRINFNRPFIATSLRDFWNRWHMSLTTWFRDYLLYSLPYVKGNQVKYGMIYRNVIITFLLMGLWHGAAWTFVIFGLFSGVMLVLETNTDKLRVWFYKLTHINRSATLQNTLGVFFTLSTLMISLSFFRANSIDDCLMMMSNAFDFSNFNETLMNMLKNTELVFGIVLVIGLLIAEHLHEKYDLIKLIASKPLVIRWSLYAGFIFFILVFGVLQNQKFLYFQF